MGKKITKPKEFYSPVKDFKYKLNDSEDGIIITKYVGKDTEVVIPPKINGLPVTTIGVSAFAGCTGLQSIVIPESVTTIGVAAFYRCNNLEWVYIKKFDWTVKDIIDIFGTNPKFKFFRTQQELDEFLNSAENPDE